jgi:lysozyme family protein
LDANGRRTQVEKFVNKSGLPLTFGEIPDLCRGFLRETKISFGKSHINGDSPFKQKLREVLERIKQTSANPSEYEKTGDLQERVAKFLSGQSDSVELSLWELRLYGGWGFSDEHFHWMMTD